MSGPYRLRTSSLDHLGRRIEVGWMLGERHWDCDNRARSPVAYGRPFGLASEGICQFLSAWIDGLFGAFNNTENGR